MSLDRDSDHRRAPRRGTEPRNALAAMRVAKGVTQAALAAALARARGRPTTQSALSRIERLDDLDVTERWKRLYKEALERITSTQGSPRR